MRRLALLVSMLIALAAPVAAQNSVAQQDGAAAPPPPEKAPALRQSTRPIVSSVAPPTPQQCRTACAQVYYFCLNEAESYECAPRWDQCRRGCSEATSSLLPR